MTQTFTGIVQYANGAPAANVRVRLFDKDVISDDDDLTTNEGISDEKGQFTLGYDPERDLDFADIYLPYLRFHYTYRDQARVHNDYIQPFERVFRLPEFPPVKFVPAQHGFQFVNRFPGYWLPFSVPSLPDIPSVSNIYGLCGGMCAASYDFMLAGIPVPERRRRPGRITALHQYLHRRQVDSLGAFGKQVVRFVRWMGMPDQAVQLRTKAEVETLKANLDHGVPTPIGLVYVSSEETWQIWQNHQVLACEYEEGEDGRLRILIYEPNHPRRNDVAIECRPDGQDGLKSVQKIGPNKEKHVRGFFVMPYKPIMPPADLAGD